MLWEKAEPAQIPAFSEQIRLTRNAINDNLLLIEEDHYNIEIYKSLSKKLNNAYPDKSFAAYPGDKTKTSKLSINKKNDMYSYLGEVYKIDGVSSYIESLTPYNDIPRIYTISSLD